MRRIVLAVCLASAGCIYAGGYGHLGTPFVGRRVSSECLDLAVAQTEDNTARSPVVVFTFGNHCFHAIPVDLSSVRAVERSATGARPLRAYDPGHELRSLRLDALAMGREEIEYVADDGVIATSVCVDVGRIDASAPPDEHWLCFGESDQDASRKSDPPPADLAAPTYNPWPVPDAVDAAVTSISAADSASIESAGAYLASHFANKRALVKAIHDYVVLRLSYDTHAANLIDQKAWWEVPSQQAEDVFARRSAVCAGYAQLMVALGKAAGVEIAYITGYARDTETVDDLENHAHAWNAANIDGAWLLIDATWDDRNGSNVSSKYLFMPSVLFATTHIPDEPAWQLLSPPLSFYEFAHQGGSR